jgi:oligo-1,6-glucosidase
MMNFWLDKGVDGFRMDVINFISKVPGFPDGEMIAGAKFGDSGPHFLNGPRIHEFLHEMNRESLSKYNVVTVGEMPGANVEQAKLYTGEERNELNMIFHFEHVDIGNGRYGKWDPQQWKLSELKRIFSRWQTGLEEAGWNSLYWSNHDQPRAVSRWANDSEEYREISAKMIATCLHFLKGTPYVYQGEELGMTNVSFEKVEDYRDVETLNAFRDLYGEGRLSLEEMMRGIHERSRDNARTPIQWDDSENGGFTTGTPWIKVNPNYKQINAKQALEDEHSIFYYYQTLIRLRKEEPVMVHGAYDVLLEDHEQLWAYTRTLENEQLLVVCNFSDTRQDFELPEAVAYERHELLIANREIEEGSSAQSFTLEPYEARVYKLFK